MASSNRVILLGHEANVVTQGQQLLEVSARLVYLTGDGESIDEPKGADEEMPVARRQAVNHRLGLVATEERAIRQPLLYGLYCSQNARVGGGQETRDRDLQQAGIQVIRVVGLNEGVGGGVKAVLADVLVDLFAEAKPGVGSRSVTGNLGELGGTVGSNPGHDLGMSEMPW